VVPLWLEKQPAALEVKQANSVEETLVDLLGKELVELSARGLVLLWEMDSLEKELVHLLTCELVEMLLNDPSVIASVQVMADLSAVW